MLSLKGNVINENELNSIMNETLNYLAQSVAQTFGPHGHNALIQTADTVYSTKDGFHTLQNINFGDTVRNSIKFLIESVAQSIVLTVGDGSSTSIMAANFLNDLLSNLKKDYTIRQLENSLTESINMIIDDMYKNATPITDENLYESIKKIAQVSTNWDEDLSTMIADIYEKTHNPIIKFEDSGTDKTYVEYIEGYDLAGSLKLPEYYANDRERNRAVVSNPIILVFNHNVQERYFLSLSCLAQIFSIMHRPLVVMAPGFDNTFMGKLAATNAVYIKQGKPIINMIACTIVNYYTVDRDCIRDFCTLIGAKPISVDDDEFNGFMDDMASAMTAQITDDMPEEEKERIKMEREATTQAALPYVLENFAGYCGCIIAGDKSIIAKELPNKDLDFVNEIKQTIKTEIDYKIKECDAKTMITDDIRMKRIRLSKLSCIMGVIKVGGYGSANIKAKKDALDDATRACEAAYRDGYHMGSCLSILKSCKTLIETADISDLNKIIIKLIQDAFAGVFAMLFINKYGSRIDDNTVIEFTDGDEMFKLTVPGIANECIERNMAFNILTDKFDVEGDVINPVSVDVEALKACMRLVIISMTSSQFITKNYETPTDTINLREVN